jgi:hypothetical protein
MHASADKSLAEYAWAVIVPSMVKFLYKYPELKVCAFTSIELACSTLISIRNLVVLSKLWSS